VTDTEVFIRVIYDLFLLSFLFSLFLGVIRGRRPLIVLFRHSRNLLSGIHGIASSFVLPLGIIVAFFPTI